MHGLSVLMVVPGVRGSSGSFGGFRCLCLRLADGEFGEKGGELVARE